MGKKVLISGRIEQEHYQQLQQIIEQTGKNESAVVREAIASYLGVNRVGAIAQMDERLLAVERRLSKIQALFLEQ